MNPIEHYVNKSNSEIKNIIDEKLKCYPSLKLEKRTYFSGNYTAQIEMCHFIETEPYKNQYPNTKLILKYSGLYFPSLLSNFHICLYNFYVITTD